MQFSGITHIGKPTRPPVLPGTVRRFKYQSAACGAEMKFSILDGARPYQGWAGRRSAAAELGITNATWPPALGIKGESDSADISWVATARW